MLRRLPMVLLLVAATLSAQVVHRAELITIVWDPVTELANGDPLPASDPGLSYDIFRNQLAGRTGVVLEDFADLELLGNVTATETIAVCAFEGWFALGVRTRRDLLNDPVDEMSPIVWSTVDAPEPFVVQCVFAPAEPGGLRLEVIVNVTVNIE